MKTPQTLAGGIAAVLILAAAAAACKSSSPTAPSNPGGGTGGGGTGGGGGSTNTTTITINANGAVTPNDITVAPGSRVTFVNNHNRNHEMNSDPHPEHTDCPAINDVGFLQPGQSRQTGNLNVVRDCRFHDHNDDRNTSLQGVIRIRQ